MKCSARTSPSKIQNGSPALRIECNDTSSLCAMPGTVMKNSSAATASGRGSAPDRQRPCTARIESGIASPWKEWYGKVPNGSR